MQTIQHNERADNQPELKALNDALSRRDTEIRSWCEKATEEIKSIGKVSTETSQALQKLSEGGLETSARLLEVEQKLARRGNNADAQHANPSVPVSPTAMISDTSPLKDVA